MFLLDHQNPIPVNYDLNKNSKYINLLAKIASAIEPVAAARIASCLVYKNQIVSFGICRRKTHPFQAKFGKNQNSIYLHSEIDCIKNSLKIVDVNELAKCTLYICRVKYESHLKQNFLFGLSKPCPGCSRAIANFGIRKVVYTLDDIGYDVL